MSSVDCAEPLLAVGRNGPWPEASGYTISGTGLIDSFLLPHRRERFPSDRSFQSYPDQWVGAYAFRPRGRPIRRQLTIAAPTAKQAPMIRAALLPVLELENMLKINATMAAPIVCPVRRAVPTMPLAPPLLSFGAAERISRALGA